jgi:hypothetical protein
MGNARGEGDDQGAEQEANSDVVGLLSPRWRATDRRQGTISGDPLGGGSSVERRLYDSSPVCV